MIFKCFLLHNFDVAFVYCGYLLSCFDYILLNQYYNVFINVRPTSCSDLVVIYFPLLLLIFDGILI